jgi:predicted phage terminase large subunit-like protein
MTVLDEEEAQADDVLELRPQAGPQEDFLSSEADIVIYGGMAGGGKTWGLLYDPARFVLPSESDPNGVKGFTAVIFRRTNPQIRNEGGLWDESLSIYPLFDGEPHETVLEWRFPGGQTIRFAGMQHEKSKNEWQGAQIPYIGFDELTHFTEEQFFYLLSRNRSKCAVKPYVRATTNPDADSWVADFIAWWIEQDEESDNYGRAIPERVGTIRYMARKHDMIHWADEPEELFHLFEGYPDWIDRRMLVKSVTFIPASVYDNKILLENNPEYLGNLEALPFVERERLLGGNWKIKPAAGNIFNSGWWKSCKALPRGDMRWVRYWDKAGTDEDEAYVNRTPYTAGVLVGATKDGLFYVADVQRKQLSSLKRNKMIQDTALDDDEYEHLVTWVEQEPGSGGKESAEISVKQLAGFNVRIERVTGDKLSRAMPASAQVEAGNVYLLEADWNQDFITELHAFPQGRLKDQADAFSGAMNKLMRRRRVDPDDYTPHTS